MNYRSFKYFILLLSLKGFSQELSVQPTTLEFNLNAPNEIQTQRLNITNKSINPQAVEIYTGDWTRNENGSHSYFDAGIKPYSCSNWMDLSEKLLVLAPGETAEVLVNIKAPDNREEMAEMKWSMIFVQGSAVKETLEERVPGVRTKINEVMRFGVHVYQTPAGVKATSAKAENLEVDKTNPQLYNFLIVNDGAMMLTATSFLELTNMATGEEFHGEQVECPIFPQGKRVVSLPLPETLPKGEYSMLAILDYGNPDSLEAIEKIVKIE